jgi:zinc protease
VRIIELRDATPLIAMRVVFRAGAVCDAPGKAGAAWLTAHMLAMGGSRRHSYAELLEAFFPMGVNVYAGVDKDMICFTAETHADNFEGFYELFSEMLLDPGWREEDLERLRDDAINFLAVTMRGQNDEELAKEALVQQIFAGHPYEAHNAGTVSSLEKLAMGDLRTFYRAWLRRDNVTIGIGGGYPAGFAARLESDFAGLAEGGAAVPEVPLPQDVRRSSALLIEKPARSVAISLGFPIEVRRGHPDYPALLVAASCLGQHRMSSGRLFRRMREWRGLNYGDYAYIEHFPAGMFLMEPPANVARRRQIFEIWIRPVERGRAHFALRLAVHELERLVEEGLSEEEFTRTRVFLSKYVNLLMKTRGAELGYLIDSDFYGTGPYAEYLREALAGLALEDVNAAARRHLRADRLKIVAVGEGMAGLGEALASDAPSPLVYNAPKPAEVIAEDEVVARRAIGLGRADVRVVPVEEMFA